MPGIPQRIFFKSARHLKRVNKIIIHHLASTTTCPNLDQKQDLLPNPDFKNKSNPDTDERTICLQSARHRKFTYFLLECRCSV
jgi:hypothetical protein